MPQILKDEVANIPVTVTLPAEQLIQLMLASVADNEVKAATFVTIREALLSQVGEKNEQ